MHLLSQGYGWERRIEVKTGLNVFQRRGKGRNEFVGQRVEKQLVDQRNMCRRCRGDSVESFLGQDRIRGPAIVFRLDPCGESTFAQSADLVRNAAAFPSD